MKSFENMSKFERKNILEVAKARIKEEKEKELVLDKLMDDIYDKLRDDVSTVTDVEIYDLYQYEIKRRSTLLAFLGCSEVWLCEKQTCFEIFNEKFKLCWYMFDNKRLALTEALRYMFANSRYFALNTSSRICNLVKIQCVETSIKKQEDRVQNLMYKLLTKHIAPNYDLYILICRYF